MKLQTTIQCAECAAWIPHKFWHEVDESYGVCTLCAQYIFPDQIFKDLLDEFKVEWLMD